MNRVESEKALKRYLKRSIGFSLTILVGFLINGQISLSADINKELQIQNLLKNIEIEKEEVREKLLELEKELAIVKNSEDYSTHFLFSPTIEHRHAKKSKDNGFSNIKEDEPNIDIPDIRDNVEPNVDDIDNPLPNEESIVKVPKFEFSSVGTPEINDNLPNINLSLDNLTIPVKEITEDEFNILTETGISIPDTPSDNLGDITLANIDQNIKINPVTPVINDVIDLSNFVVGEILVTAPNVTTPDSFSLDTVKIKSGSFQQTSTEPNYTSGNDQEDNKDLYAVRNYTRYVADTNGFNIWVSGRNLYYDTTSTRGDKSLILNDNIKLEYGDYASKYKLTNNKIPVTTTYISDVIGKDVSVEGPYTLTYEGNRNEQDTSDLYVRIFLSSVSNGLNSSNEKVKLTEFSGELNLATTNSKDFSGTPLYGNLIGIEHQLGNINLGKTSILLNSGKINIGNRLNPSEGSAQEKNQEVVNKNMIGIMIDSLQTLDNNKGKGKTINAGEINIIKPELLPDEKDFTPQNNIGISFEENEDGTINSNATLKDDVYIGKINIGDGTTQNYGFRMGNIYNDSLKYFDETQIIGKMDDNKIEIENPDKSGSSNSETKIETDENEKQYINYTSDIVVAGSKNVGMVVGKSLSSDANLNPIANFKNISIKVNGDQTIGFVRDKNYSNNNTNDMIITDSNLNNIRFGANATNSVLFRSEMYGITNETTINVTPETDGNTQEKVGEENTSTITYNVAMQATVQSWDKDGEGTVNSSGSVTNGKNGTISTAKDTTADYMIGMMASGTIDSNIDTWQNGYKPNEGKALATNKGTISLTGSNNIGMAIMDNNLGNNSGTITISGANGVGIYNTGNFNNSGTITVTGINGIGIYNSNSGIFNLGGTIEIVDNSNSQDANGNVGVYSEGGTINFSSNDMTTLITGEGNSVAGIYTKTHDTNLTGNVNITGTKVGLVSNDITTKIDGTLEYNGEGFALYTKGDNGKIEFTQGSTLSLGESAYGFDIVDTSKEGSIKQFINFNGAKIEIKSNDVTLFNINGNGTEYSSKDIESGNSNLPGEEYLEQFVGQIGEIKNSYEINGETITYDGYKIASIENGKILLNSTNGNNEEFLKKYKFQKSIVNMSTDTNLSLTNTEADTYFSGEVIGIGISSNVSKDETPTELDDAQINIGNSTLTANRTEEAPKVSESENSSTKSTIGAYIDYGIINLTKGHIIVEKAAHQTDTVNDNGIGIYSKNGSEITTDEDSSITVYGNNGIGIYAEATKNEEIINSKNKFGGDITQLNISNAGTIDVSSGTGGIGIFADGGTGEKGSVTNSGNIKVGGGTNNDSSVGIYGINVDITNTGNIQVGCQHNSDTVSHAGVGIYAQNSNITIGDATNKKVEFTLGDFATGIHLDEDSSLTLNSDLKFNSLKTQNITNTTDRIGIYAESKNSENVKDIDINQNIDMSDVVGGKAVIVDGRIATLSEGREIKISGNNGRGLRVLNDGTITNNGIINITNSGEIKENKNTKNPSSIGMVAADTNGIIANEGTIDINSTNGIGIYVDNSDENIKTSEKKIKEGNIITSIGTINLNGNNNIGVVAKEFDLTFGGEDSLSTGGITFKNSNGIGVYAENSNITINEEISKIFGTNQTNNILIASIGKENSETKVIENNSTISLNGSNNIGIYLGNNTKYSSDIDENKKIKGSIEVSDGAIGIYVDEGANVLENINIKSDSKGNQTIGVVLQGKNNSNNDKEIKNISGNITLTNSNNEVVQGKNLGIYANNSNVVVNDTLTLNNDKSNGTGLYLNDSTLSGSGTIKIMGEGKDKTPNDNIEDIPNSVGIYYTSTNENPSITNNSITVEVDKSNTIGVYVANNSTLTKQSSGGITIGDSKEVSNVTGLVASNNSTINNEGKVTLTNTLKSIGLASLGGTINNSGVITLGENTESGTGVFLTGNSIFDNEIAEKKGTIKIDSEGNENGVGIGIYTKGENVTIGSTGNFDMAKGNIAIYSDGTNISSDINLLHKDEDNNVLDTNSGTTALVIKSDIKSEEDDIVKGTTVGGESVDDKMNITLAKGSTGVYVLDSGVKLSNLSIDATTHNKDSNDLSYGIYLHSEKDGDYNITNTDISLVKGVGIVVDSIANLQENEKNTNLVLSGSTITVNSYSEGDEAETGIGIYTQSGNITLAGGNTINTTYGVGVFGGENSNISIGDDTLNLKGYSVGVYSNGGSVNLGENTDITFQQGKAQNSNDGEVSKGVGAYVIDGTITSSADIKIDEKNTIISDGIVGILGKQSIPNTQEETVDKEVDITNSGNIELSGNSVVGIAGIGNETSTEKVSITNSGNIVISGNKENISTGIYGQDANIINGGSITVGNYATGIYYTGNKNNNIHSESINLVGEDSIGAILKGNTESTNLAGVYGDISKERNLGIYLDNYSSNSTNIGNIELGNQSMGLYINNSNTTINSIGDITAGIKGIGIASVGNSSDGTDTVTITNNGSISVGNNGTAVYVQDSTLNMDSLAGVTAGTDGAVLRVNNGTLNLETTINELTFNGNTGIVLENGGNITSQEGNIDTINVINGGTGIFVKGDNTKNSNNSDNPDILAKTTTINLGSGDENKYSVGAYYQNTNVLSDNIEDENKININIARKEGSHHTIGTIYDRTYGVINDFNATMNNTISDSIGTIIRRDGTNIVDNDKTVTLNAGEDSILANINGNHNIGIAGKNSLIVANGDIKVGIEENIETLNENKNSIGVYLTGDNKDWEHSYTGTGDIEVGNNGYGIYAKNYDATHNGNISVNGNGSVGIASVIEDKEGQAHDHTHTITINNGTINVENNAIGVFGRDTNIDINNGNLEISGNNTTGIASLKNGNINFDGSANISGENSVGIYKNTSQSEEKNESNTITVGNGEWKVGDLSNGIVAISRTVDENGNISGSESITIDNSSNMTLSNGAIGIYSVGANTVTNKGVITVGGAIINEEKTLASVGIYMANGVGNTMAIGTNDGNIIVENNGGVGIQAAGYVKFTNNGNIKVSNGAEGMHASYSATITNEGNITVTGKGTGMVASGNGSQAINKGTINLEKNDSILTAEELANKYNTSLIGMAATDGGHIINDEKGIINVNDGIGMYIDEESSFANNGTINVNDGVGIMGVGKLENTGKITVNSSNGTATVELDENLSDKGSLVINREEGILEVNDNFSNIGGILETDYNIKLNNPTIDITAGGAGFIAPNVSGDIKLDSNFALEGDGLSFSVEDFIEPDTDININTSPLFKTDINEGDLTVNKVDYKDITVGTQFDNRDNALDDILAGGGVDADILKNLNYYLDSLGNTTVFNSEANRLLGAIGGESIYSNIQSRMQDISRNFDNSFVEMIESENPTYENSKYHLIYTDGDYKNSNKNVANYDYNIIGLNYMKEYDSTEQGQKYGYTFGFTGTKFKFDDFSGSEEDVYSLRGGAHRINYFDNGVSWLTRAELGYNHHRIERKVNIPNANINNRDWYSSYQVSLDNRLRKEMFADENSNFGAYTALNLEYGLFDDINEKGDLELKVKSNDYFSSKAMIGLDGKLSKPLNDTWSIRFNGDVNYSYDFGNNYDENEAKFRSNGDYYSLSSELKSRDVVSGRLSIALDKSDYFTISLHGQASTDFRRDEDYWNVGLTFIYRFNNHAVPEKFLDMHNYFEFDKSEIKAKDKENIKEMAEYINENNMQGTLLIEGHTDDRGSNSYNDKLSLERANSVKEEFEKTLNNNDNIQIKVVGYGEDKPEYKNINESARSKNRRAQVNILNK